MPAIPDLIQQTMDRFWDTVPPVWNTVRSQVRAMATHHFDITEEQFHILRHVHKGARSVSELAKIGRISRPAISQALDTLVNKGLVSRQQSKEDRRYVRLELTKKGTALLDDVFGQSRQWMKEKFSTLGADDLNAVMSGLAILKDIFCGEFDR